LRTTARAAFNKEKPLVVDGSLPNEKGSNRRASSSRGGASEETATRGSEETATRGSEVACDCSRGKGKSKEIVESSGELDQAPLAEETCVALVREEIAEEAWAWSDLRPRCTQERKVTKCLILISGAS
jgi:hypothetical protein